MIFEQKNYLNRFEVRVICMSGRFFGKCIHDMCQLAHGHNIRRYTECINIVYVVANEFRKNSTDANLNKTLHKNKNQYNCRNLYISLSTSGCATHLFIGKFYISISLLFSKRPRENIYLES